MFLTGMLEERALPIAMTSALCDDSNRISKHCDNKKQPHKLPNSLSRERALHRDQNSQCSASLTAKQGHMFLHGQFGTLGLRSPWMIASVTSRAAPENLLEMQILSPYPDVWVWDQQPWAPGPIGTGSPRGWAIPNLRCSRLATWGWGPPARQTPPSTAPPLCVWDSVSRN